MWGQLRENDIWTISISYGNDALEACAVIPIEKQHFTYAHVKIRLFVYASVPGHNNVSWKIFYVQQ